MTLGRKVPPTLLCLVPELGRSAFSVLYLVYLSRRLSHKCFGVCISLGSARLRLLYLSPAKLGKWDLYFTDGETEQRDRISNSVSAAHAPQRVPLASVS